MKGVRDVREIVQVGRLRFGVEVRTLAREGEEKDMNFRPLILVADSATKIKSLKLVEHLAPVAAVGPQL